MNTSSQPWKAISFCSGIFLLQQKDLRSKISEGQDTCSNLRRSLGDLRGVLGDILKPEDMRGEVKVMHLSSDHINTLQSTLSTTQDLANDLSNNLAGEYLHIVQV